MNQMHLRQIPLDGAYNVRDLGGYPTQDDRVTRWGLIYRGDSLAMLSDDDWKKLAGDRNIRTVLDFRGTAEAMSTHINTPEGVMYKRFSLMPSLDNVPSLGSAHMQSRLAALSYRKLLKSMLISYEKTVFGNIKCCVEILNTIMERMSCGNVIFVCSAGKDRTGITAAMLLWLCDVYTESIIADYMVSSTYNTNGINKKIDSIPKSIKHMVSKKTLLSMFDSKAETMKNLIDAFERDDLRKALADNGFSYESQSKLKGLLTEKIG